MKWSDYYYFFLMLREVLVWRSTENLGERRDRCLRSKLKFMSRENVELANSYSHYRNIHLCKQVKKKIPLLQRKQCFSVTWISSYRPTRQHNFRWSEFGKKRPLIFVARIILEHVTWMTSLGVWRLYGEGSGLCLILFTIPVFAWWDWG